MLVQALSMVHSCVRYGMQLPPFILLLSPNPEDPLQGRASRHSAERTCLWEAKLADLWGAEVSFLPTNTSLTPLGLPLSYHRYICGEWDKIYTRREINSISYPQTQ